MNITRRNICVLFNEFNKCLKNKQNQLNLSSESLTFIPNSIKNLTHLKKLYLSWNKLTSIPGNICMLTQLKELHACYNKLTSIPNTIKMLKNLTELYLSNNQLRWIPKSIGNLTQLKELHLDNNQLTFIPKEIGNLIQLKELYLDHNKLHWIPKSIGNLIQLRTLLLIGNKLSYIPIRNLCKHPKFDIDMAIDRNFLSENMCMDLVVYQDNNYSKFILKYLNNIYYVKLTFYYGLKHSKNTKLYKYFYNDQQLFDINLIPLIFKYLHN
jgi:Leucine-rich repeat (LRR) protein